MDLRNLKIHFLGNTYLFLSLRTTREGNILFGRVKMEIEGTSAFSRVAREGPPSWLSPLSVRRLISAQVLMSQVMSLSPIFGSMLGAEPALKKKKKSRE